MTKGELLEKNGLSMIRKDLDEEADEKFEKFVQCLVQAFDEFEETTEDDF